MRTHSGICLKTARQEICNSLAIKIVPFWLCSLRASSVALQVVLKSFKFLGHIENHR